jgi:hypothetical protein
LVYEKKTFVIAKYISDSSGKIRAKKPESCPNARIPGTCHISIFAYRSRVYSHGYKLNVFYCKNHGRHFTAYPPGFVPYSRRPLLNLAPDGQGILPQNLSDSNNSSLDKTFFSGVIDAAKGYIYPEEKQLGARPEEKPAAGCAKSQILNIYMFMLLFGLLKTSHKKRREKIATVLNIDLSLLEDSRRQMNPRIRDGPIEALRGQLGLKILERLLAQTNVITLLLQLGKNLLWGSSILPRTCSYRHDQ